MAAIRKITHTCLTKLKATVEAQNISCGEGLILHVGPKGKKSCYLRSDTISAESKRKHHVVSLVECMALVLKEVRVEADKRKTYATTEDTNIAKLERVEKIARGCVGKIPTF